MSYVKTLSFLALLSFSIHPSLAQESGFIEVRDFGGIDQYRDSSRIANSDSVDASNVLTDKGFLEKREGNVRLRQILANYAVEYLTEFRSDTDGNRYLIAHASTTVYYFTPTSGTVALTTVSAGFFIDTAIGNNRVYITNGFDAVRSWNTNTLAYPSGSPRCNLIEFKDERIWCAQDYVVSISSTGSDTSFTPPSVLSQANEPGEFVLGRNDGEQIICMRNTPWGMFVGKRTKSYVIKGSDSFDYVQQLLDPKIGCVSDRTFQMIDGLAYWLGLEGIYRWDGAGPPELASLDIDPVARAIRQSQAFTGNVVFGSQAQWESGTNPDNGTIDEWDTASIPGSILSHNFPNVEIDDVTADFGAGTLSQLSTNTVNSLLGPNVFGLQVGTLSFQNAGFEGMSVGEQIPLGSTSNWSGGSNGEIISSATFQFGDRCLTRPLLSNPCTTSDGAHRIAIEDSNNSNIWNHSLDPDVPETVTYWVDITTFVDDLKINMEFTNNSMRSAAFPKRGAKFIGLRAMVSNANCGTGFRYYYDVAQSTFLPEGVTYRSSGSFVSASYDTSMATPTWGPADFAVTYSTNGNTTVSIQTSVDDATWSSSQTVTDLQKIPSPQRRYFRYRVDMTSPDGANTPLFDRMAIGYISTGTHTSPVLFISSEITSWKDINFTETSIPSGRLAYQVRSGTYGFSATDTAISWTAQSNNSVVVVATGTHLQLRFISTVNSSTETAQVDQVQISWQDGTNKPPASGVNQRRYFLSITTISSSQNNDLVLVYQKNDKWTYFRGPSYFSMGEYDDNLLAGDSSTNSYVWKTMQPGVYNDDGVPIEAYWVTKDFTGDNAFQMAQFRYKHLNGIWVQADSIAGSSVTVSYAVDKSPNYTDRTLNLNLTSNVITRHIPIAAGYAKGRFFRFKLENMDLDDYMRIHGLIGVYDIAPLRPDD